MGFRNPITSASAVDTRTAPTVPGVRIYVAPNPDGTGTAKGVVEWDDGVSSDVPALAGQTVAPASGPRGAADPFGRLWIKGGSYGTPSGLMAAPELDLGVEQDSAGHPIPVGRIVGGPMRATAFTDLSGDDLYNGGTAGVLAGAAPPAGTKLLRKTYVNAALAANASGDNTVVFPGGAFPHGLVDLQVESFPNGLSAAPSTTYWWYPWAPTLAQVNVRCFSAAGAAVAGTLGISVTALGW